MSTHRIRSVPPFYHWFAVELYEFYNSLVIPGTAGTFSVTFCGCKFEIDLGDLEKVSKSIQSICSFNRQNDEVYIRGMLSDPVLTDCEKVFTCLFSKYLDRFVFSDASHVNGAFLHQMPTRCQERDQQKIDSVDISCIRMQNGSPHKPISLADMKISDLPLACGRVFVSCREWH